MKTIQYLLLAAFLSVAVCSCVDDDEQGSSTPIDSTNLNGTAPAEYKASTTASDTAYPRYEGQYDSGLRANTASTEDTVSGRAR